MTDRAVSTTLSYAMSLTIITLLVTGVFMATGDFVEDERERTVRSEFKVLGNRIAADIAAVDRLAGADTDSTAELTTDLPTTVAGKTYRINVTNNATGPNDITLSTSSEPLIEVTVTVKTERPIATTTLSGGAIKVTYDGANVEVTRA